MKDEEVEKEPWVAKKSAKKDAFDVPWPGWSCRVTSMEINFVDEKGLVRQISSDTCSGW